MWAGALGDMDVGCSAVSMEELRRPVPWESGPAWAKEEVRWMGIEGQGDGMRRYSRL